MIVNYCTSSLPYIILLIMCRYPMGVAIIKRGATFPRAIMTTSIGYLHITIIYGVSTALISCYNTICIVNIIICAVHIFYDKKYHHTQMLFNFSLRLVKNLEPLSIQYVKIIYTWLFIKMRTI